MTNKKITFLLILAVMGITPLHAMMPEDVQQEYDRRTQIRQTFINMIKSTIRDISIVLDQYDKTFHATTEISQQIASLETLQTSLSLIYTGTLGFLMFRQYGKTLAMESIAVRDYLTELSKTINLILQRLKPLSADKKFPSFYLTRQIQVWEDLQTKINQATGISVSPKEVAEEG